MPDNASNSEQQYQPVIRHIFDNKEFLLNGQSHSAMAIRSDDLNQAPLFAGRTSICPEEKP